MATVGVKETKEAILGLAILGAFVVERAKDGVGLDDAVALAQKLAVDEVFKAKIQAAVEGIDKIPAEAADLSLTDILELAKLIPELVEIVSPKAA